MGGYFCKIATWSLSNWLKCVNVDYTSRKFDPVTGNHPLLIQQSSLYAFNCILYYPFALNSNDMFLFVNNTSIYGFSSQANTVYSNTTAINLV
jgi:hypothetical protein